MRAASIGLAFAAFFAAGLAIASLIVLLVPFPTRTLSLDPHRDDQPKTYSIFGFTITKRDDFEPTSTSPLSKILATPIDLTPALAQDANSPKITPTLTRPVPQAQAQPTKLPAPIEQRQFTGFTGDHFTFSHSDPGFGSGWPFGPNSGSGSGSGSPFGRNSITVDLLRPAGDVGIILLVAYVLLIIEILALGIYFLVKSTRVGASSSVQVAGAIFHFAFLIVLAILLLIPLAFLLHAVDLFNREGRYLGSTFLRNTDFYQDYIGKSNSFSFIAGPVVATLVLGWLLWASTIALAVLVLLHRERKAATDLNSKVDMKEREV